MTRHRSASATPPTTGSVSYWPQGTLRSWTVGALPILNHLLQRLNLAAILQAHLPPDDRRCKIPTVQGLLVLVANLLISREPLYGLAEWASRHDPHQLGLAPEQLQALNDDRLGRCLTAWFRSDHQAIILDLVRQVVTAFGVRLDELHNDSTTVTFQGAYADADEPQTRRDKQTLVITWGHNKDHRPDLKQLLYILTLSADGGVPVHYRAAQGNVTDDTTHRDSWDTLCRIAGRCDFLYVADCKLATFANMQYIADHHGRFVSVLPRTRKEDAAFRARLVQEAVTWQPLWDKRNDDDEVCDRFSILAAPVVLPEGYHLWWFHSTRKAELDLAARSGHLQRAEQRLRQLQAKLRSPRTRLRDPGKVQDLVQQILQHDDVAAYVQAQVVVRQEEEYRQRRRGRPTANTEYVCRTRTRLDLTYTLLADPLVRERQTDGIFPLVTNDTTLTALQVLLAYKRQPQIEKRFEQLKTDYAVAPVFLKDVGRIEALLGVYFLALLVESLLERELRQGMARAGLESLPLYPEGRACRQPTTRRLLDVFEPIQRHTLQSAAGAAQTAVSDLSALQQQLLGLLGIPTTAYAG